MSENKIVRSVEEVERAMEIMLTNVHTAATRGEADEPAAMGAIIFGWLFGWEKIGAHFQEMIERCNAHDASLAKRHKHGNPKRRATRKDGCA